MIEGARAISIATTTIADIADPASRTRPSPTTITRHSRTTTRRLSRITTMGLGAGYDAPPPQGISLFFGL